MVAMIWCFFAPSLGAQKESLGIAPQKALSFFSAIDNLGSRRGKRSLQMAKRERKTEEEEEEEERTRELGKEKQKETSSRDGRKREREKLIHWQSR